MVITLSCIQGILIGLEEKKVKAYILDFKMPQQRCRYNEHLTNHASETSKNSKCGVKVLHMQCVNHCTRLKGEK